MAHFLHFSPRALMDMSIVELKWWLSHAQNLYRKMNSVDG